MHVFVGFSDSSNHAYTALSADSCQGGTQHSTQACLCSPPQALLAGTSQELSDAIFDSVLPRRAGDILPKTQPGLLAAFADRLDSIVGLIAAGCAPSSAADPFGVRRDAYALLQVGLPEEG